MANALNRIDPEVRVFLDTMKEDWKQYPPFESLPLPEARKIVEQVRARWTKGGPIMAETTEQDVETAVGRLRIREYRPHNAGKNPPVMIYIHGGGFTLFSLDTHDRLMREYAERAGIVVIGVDYPLAPEIKFPHAMNLITAFTVWLSENAEEMRVDPENIILAGDSAGGNLAIATCLSLRDMNRLDIVRSVVSNYGGFSGRISEEADALFGGPDSILSRDEAAQYWMNYLNDKTELDNPYANPVHADLHGLPPVFLAIAEIDVVAESSIIFGQKLVAHGNEVTQKMYLGAPHSFIEAMSISKLASQAIDDGVRFLKNHLSQAKK